MLSLLARAAAGPLRSLSRSVSLPSPSLSLSLSSLSRSVPLSPPCWAPRGLLAVPPLPGRAPVAGLKTKTVLRRRCKDCYIVRRRGRLYVCCKTNPRHKQRQG
ncbi:RM36 protein, partial [Xiphorhynchus elegans]|nr:RM36 protein [Xiphorhynchus elegans]